MSGDDHAHGRVHELTQGQRELNDILASAARRRQLVLVDYSASWCGPCRMMLPVLQQLAAEHRGRLAVVKVDCEQTAANQGLARTAAIRAFPTFHLYRNHQRVAEKAGADPNFLRRAIQEQLAQLGGGGGGPGAMAATLAAALARVKASCSFEEFVAATRTLLLFVGNVIDHPGEEKFRRVKASNTAYHGRLGCRPGGRDCMAAIGFREMMEAGEAVLVMTDVPEELPRVRTLLQQAVDQAQAAAAGAAAAQQRAAAAAAVPASAPAAAPASAPLAAAALPAAAAGAAGASTPATSNVDATALARALAAALTTSSGGPSAGARAGAAQTASTVVQPAAGAAAGRRRVIRVSAKGLARVLEKVLAEAGIGVAPAPAGGQQQQQQQQGGNAQ